MKDKVWVTSALKKSCHTKNTLYKKWVLTRLPDDEQAYKNYRKIFKKLAAEAEISYYKSQFDSRTNSIKQLWRNLNTVCSFKGGRTKHQTISKLRINDHNYVTTADDISNGLNNYFSTVGEKLVQN